MSRLTEMQERVLQFIVSRWEAGESLPSCREIAAHFGWASPKSASDSLDVLKQKGHLSVDPGSSRKYRLTPQVMGLPLRGTIPAGFPVDQSETNDEHFFLSPQAFGIQDRNSAFMLRVNGDSMIGRHIFDGDLVLLERTTHPRHLNIVAALIDNEVTLKTLVVEKTQSWLRSENPRHPDLRPLHELQIQGVARAVIRPLKP
jgi:repressor LexA